MATYKLDVLKESQKRLIWIHRDQSEETAEEHKNYIQARTEEERIKQRPLIQPITQVCEGDIIEIAVNFYSM